MKSASQNGTIIEVGLSNASSTVFDNAYKVNISSLNVWETKRISITNTSWRYFGIRSTVNNPTIYFDSIGYYAWSRNEYIGNLIQKKYTLDNKGYKVNLTLNEYDYQANTELFNLEKKAENTHEILLST